MNSGDEDMSSVTPYIGGSDWIDELSDAQCMEIFWLLVDPPEQFLDAHPPGLLGQAMRHALRTIVREHGLPGPG